MIGLNLWFRTLEGNAETFPSFGADFISDYDSSNETYRLHVRNAFRSHLRNFVEQCEDRGYLLVDFQFAIERREPFRDPISAYEISYQDFGFFEHSMETSWEGNEQQRIQIPDGAAIVETANQIVFVEEIASYLKTIRADLRWQKVETIDKYKRRFWRLLPKPEHSFLSHIPLINSVGAFNWVAGAAEPPDDLFFDTIAVGPEAAFHPLIASRTVAMKLLRKFPGFPLIPVLASYSTTGKAVVSICELLKPRIRKLQS